MKNRELPIHFYYSESKPKRIDLYLSKKDKLKFSRNRTKDLIKQGFIRVNKEEVKPSTTLKQGDIISVHLPQNKELPLKAENIPLDIFYEDHDVLIINKQAGIIVHPTEKVKTGTLVNAIIYHCQGRLPGINGVNSPGIVHRLDKDTSGLIMVAKTERAQRFLTQQIKERMITKIYLGLVHGLVKDQKGFIEAPIGRDHKHGNKMAISGIASRDAKTYFEIIDTFNHATLLFI